MFDHKYRRKSITINRLYNRRGCAIKFAICNQIYMNLLEHCKKIPEVDILENTFLFHCTLFLVLGFPLGFR